MCKYTK